jgi:hypothetical protein
MAAPAPAPRYIHDIQSIRGVHPELPNILCNFNLNMAINAGDPINRNFLTDAQNLVRILKGVQGIILFSLSLASAH